MERDRFTSHQLGITLQQEASERSGPTTNQERLFNLEKTFKNSIEVAEYLLEKEYGDSHLFKKDVHEAVFIPPVFTSDEFSGKNTTAILDYDIAKTFEKTLINLKVNRPHFWFTKELEMFTQGQLTVSTKHEKEDDVQDTEQEINIEDYDDWIVKIKILFLTWKNVPEFENPPSALSNLRKHLAECLGALKNHVPSNTLADDMEKQISLLNDKRYATKWVDEKLQATPLIDSILKWFFNLDLTIALSEEPKHWLFDQLTRLRDDEVLQDMVVLHNVEFYSQFEEQYSYKIDVLVFSPKHKLIIAFEIARILTKRTFEFLEHLQLFFRANFRDLLDGWTFLPIILMKRFDSQYQEECKQSKYIITMETNIKSYLTDILKEQQSKDESEDSKDKLKKILQILVFTLNASPTRPITASNWVEYIAKSIKAVSTKDNIIFYSQNQLPIFTTDDTSYQKVIIRGDDGCGKRFLLQEKVELLQEQGYSGQILYVILYADVKEIPFSQLLVQHLKVKWNGNVEVKSISTTKLLDCVKEVKKKKAVFIDEFTDYPDYSSYWVALLIKLAREKDLEWLWLRYTQSRIPNKEYINKDFKTLDLTFQMRYFNIEKGTRAPPNFPTRKSPIIVDNINQALEEAKKLTKKGILIVLDPRDLKSALSNLSTIEQMTMAYVEDCGLGVDVDVQKRISKIEESLKFLTEEKKQNVLIVSCAVADGFEWPTIITHPNHPNRYTCTSYCTTNLILVNSLSDCPSRSYTKTKYLHI